VLTVFPAYKGATRLYEDEGNTNNYLDEACAWTPVTQYMPDHHTLNVRIGAAEGHYPGMADRRSYTIRVKGILPPQAVLLNGAEVPYDLHGKPGNCTGSTTATRLPLWCTCRSSPCTRP
jgi:hypothetical protein